MLFRSKLPEINSLGGYESIWEKNRALEHALKIIILNIRTLATTTSKVSYRVRFVTKPCNRNTLLTAVSSNRKAIRNRVYDRRKTGPKCINIIHKIKYIR